MLTKRQKEVLDFITSYSSKKGYAPSLEEIRKRLKLASVSTIHFHVARLRDSGYLSKEENKPRSIDVLKRQPMTSIPLLGTIAAGEPIEAIHHNEFIAVPKSKLPPSGTVYALRVRGNSMIDENIKDGDVVLVKQQETATNGQRVVALIDNYEATLKKFYRERNQIRLQPANSLYERIIIKGKGKDVKIQGVVIDIIQHDTRPNVETINPATVTKKDKTLPLNKIILGDAVAELKKLPDESCDVIIIDPPYNIGKDFGNNGDKRELNEYASWCKEWINESVRVMKPTDSFIHSLH